MLNAIEEHFHLSIVPWFLLLFSLLAIELFTSRFTTDNHLGLSLGTLRNAT